MGFISNAERERKLERVNRRNWGRKVFICVTLVLFLAFLTLSVVASFLSEDNKVWAWSAAGFNVNGTYLTPFGWFMFVLVVACAVCGILSIIFVFTFQSASKVFHEAMGLATTPLSGRATTKETAKYARQRLTTKAIKD